MIQRTRGEKIFNVFNYIILTIFAFTTLYPLLYTLSISLSTAGEANRVGLHILPNFEQFTLDPYKLVFQNAEIWTAYKYTLFRTIVGTILALLVTCFYGYALSRPGLPLKKFFSSYILFTMLFSGGQIPSYLNIRDLGLINSIWVYVLPMLITAYNVIVAKSFFATLPESLNESAKIDGAGEFRIFFQIIVPLSKPIIMTVALWVAVTHWNSWFDGMMYITDSRKQTVQNYIQRIVSESQTENLISNVNAAGKSQMETTGETIQCASIIVSVIPILLFYPFVQKYFVKGVTLGAVKG